MFNYILLQVYKKLNVVQINGYIR